MKTFSKLATIFLMVIVASAFALAQAEEQVQKPLVAAANLTEGASSTPGNTGDWEGWSEVDYIPGAALFGVTGTSTYLTIGFSAGSTVDINSMVLYTTARGSNVITKISKVKYLTKANPSINLTSTTTCPTQPVSAAHPCLIRLDKVTLQLLPTNDYYFAIYFTSDSNNNSMRGSGGSPQSGALMGWQIDGSDGLIPVGGTVPVGNQGSAPLFLMYLTNE